MSTDDDGELRAAKGQLSAALRERATAIAGPSATFAEVEAALQALQPLVVEMFRAEIAAVAAAGRPAPSPPRTALARKPRRP
jgi:hypothetical protein